MTVIGKVEFTNIFDRMKDKHKQRDSVEAYT